MALALTRRKGEKILIEVDDQTLIEICIADITSKKVKLALEAPKRIPIYREEIWNKRKAQQKTG